mmetsp:Transcript_3118/g.6784  ORF Transcript_3118/g.6784 Transcript_3118/m.6784 type:complete len:439 (+) Transcript_3118:144-1460(+)|eukprot:CAMPEP_0202911304 /NCGR_PEP_ID=MMETSP1392-20130828/54566_1 /ASSEMBLY_ACC=CAM_ASM_000868 /TAXON_ID=225041 /ORGANISM="Chlamydomonas chlamydogama, Strain SAG 11-48b" /LENGTH=438 /DNA_ID=CAMNT_0049601755 /DNA_START=85 /DNA_END=1401 /DNA_ORIENTATION=-
MGGLQEEVLRDLRDSGLFDFAASIDYVAEMQLHCNQNGNLSCAPTIKEEPIHQQQWHQQQQQQQQPCRELCSGITSSQAATEGTSQVNSVGDTQAARAAHVLHVSRAKLHNIVSGPVSRSPAVGSSCSDGSHKATRKSSRNVVEQSAGRSANKGLRYYSMKVCEKVESKGRTTYTEVADELVNELSQGDFDTVGQCDEKNIRRRVYDAFNVLMAMGIFDKERKEIIWRGLSKSSGNSLERLQAERLHKIREVERKQNCLQELVEQHAALKQLLQRDSPKEEGSTALHLPFILVQAKKDATVEVRISEDMLDVQFDFYNSPFQIHDDSYVLKNLAIHRAQDLGKKQVIERASSSPSPCSPTAPVHSCVSSLADSTAVENCNNMNISAKKASRAAITAYNSSGSCQTGGAPGLTSQLQSGRAASFCAPAVPATHMFSLAV